MTTRRFARNAQRPAGYWRRERERRVFVPDDLLPYRDKGELGFAVTDDVHGISKFYPASEYPGTGKGELADLFVMEVGDWNGAEVVPVTVESVETGNGEIVRRWEPLHFKINVLLLWRKILRETPEYWREQRREEFRGLFGYDIDYTPPPAGPLPGPRGRARR